MSRRVGHPLAGRKVQQRQQNDNLLEMPRIQEIFNPLAVMLMGPRGRGKTLALDALGAMMKERYLAEGYACKVFANFPTTDADVADPRVMQWVTSWDNVTIRDGLLEADEIQGEAASAKWNSNTNFDVVQTLQQVRKKMLECAFTTQYPRGIEKGLLEQVDFFVEVRKLGDGYALGFAVHDWKDLLTQTPRRHRPFPPFWWEADWFYTWFGTKQFFGNYATLGSQVPRYMAQKDKDRWERLTQNEWRRLGYQLSTVEENEDLTAWSGTELGRIEAPRLAVPRAVEEPQDWKEVLQRQGQFSVYGMYHQLRAILPEGAKSVAQFRKVLENEGFHFDGEFGIAP